MIRVMLVDDHQLFREGLKCLFMETNDIRVVKEADNGKQAVALFQNKSSFHDSELPHLILMDIKMPEMNGIEATQALLKIDPSIKIVILSVCYEHPIPTKLLQMGIMGYLTKDTSPEDLILAIRRVALNGQRFIHPDIMQQVALNSVNEIEDESLLVNDLSDRELQVLKLIAQGKRIQQISTELGLSPKTVNSYRYRLFEKLQVKSDIELTHFVLRNSLFVNKEVETET